MKTLVFALVLSLMGAQEGNVPQQMPSSETRDAFDWLEWQSNRAKGSPPDVELTFRALRIPEIQNRFVGATTKADRIAQGRRVFDSDKEWNEFQAEVGARNFPNIDFSRRRVVGIFLGPKTAGWSVRIDRATYSEGTKETSVSYIVEEPKPGRVYPTVIGYPLVIAEIERRPGSISFVRDCCR